MAAFKIDFLKITSELLLQEDVASFCSTERRTKQIVLNRGPEQALQEMSLLKPEDLQERFFQSTLKKRALHNSINDDLFIVQEIGSTSNSKMAVQYVDASKQEEFSSLKVSADEDCLL